MYAAKKHGEAADPISVFFLQGHTAFLFQEHMCCSYYTRRSLFRTRVSISLIILYCDCHSVHLLWVCISFAGWCITQHSELRSLRIHLAEN